MNLIERLNKIRTYFLLDHPFWGTIIANLKFEINENLPTYAATDGYSTIYFNPSLCENISNDDLKFIVMHELLHIVLLHPLRKEARHHELWNIACDFAVNYIAKDEMNLNTKLDLLYDKKFQNKSAEEIYSLLFSSFQNLANKLTNQSSSSLPSPDLQPSGASNEPNESYDNSSNSNNQTTSSSPSTSTSTCTCPSSSTSTSSSIDNYISDQINKTLSENSLKPKDFINQPSTSQSVKEKIEKVKSIIVQANMIRNKIRNKGDLPSSVEEFIKQIIEPKLPFDILLSRYVSKIVAGKSEFTYNKLNKKLSYFHDIAAPTTCEEELNIIISIDTSGSISTEELQLFAGAIKKISSITQQITIITSDCHIQQIIHPEEIDKFLKELKFIGRGGTSHIPVFEYINKHFINEVDLVICLTDLETDFPKKKPSYPVLWISTNKDINRKRIPFGQVIFLDTL